MRFFFFPPHFFISCFIRDYFWIFTSPSTIFTLTKISRNQLHVAKGPWHSAFKVFHKVQTKQDPQDDGKSDEWVVRLQNYRLFKIKLAALVAKLRKTAPPFNQARILATQFTNDQSLMVTLTWVNFSPCGIQMRPLSWAIGVLSKNPHDDWSIGLGAKGQKQILYSLIR